MSQDFKIFLKIFFDILLLLVPLEILSIYPDIDISHWHRDDVQWVMDKAYGLKGFDTFFAHFSTEFLVFACICCCFNSHKTFCDVF